MAKKNAPVDGDAEVVTEAPQAVVADAALPEKDPGKVLGVVAVVISLGAGIIGIVLGVLAYRKSRAAGFNGGLGMAAMILGTVTSVLLVLQLTLLANGMGVGGACDGLREGVHELDNGKTISCT